VTQRPTEVAGVGDPHTPRPPGRVEREVRSAVVRWALAAIWVTAATVLQLSRQPGVPSLDTIWAEDGQLFLSAALQEPTGSILDPAGGYLHLAPRLLATFAATLPLESAALVFSVGSALLVSLLSLYVFVASRSLIVSPWARAVLAGSMVVLPAALFESVANAANLQYYFLFAAFWALLHRPSGWPAAAAGGAVAAVAAMSTTISIVLSPLAVWSVVRGPGTKERTIAIAFVAGLLAQTFTVFRAVVLDVDPSLGAQYPLRWGASTPSNLAGLFGIRVVAALLLGDRWVDEGWSALGWWLAAATGVGLGALFVMGVRSATRGLRLWIAIALVLSLASFALPVLVRGTAHLLPTSNVYTFAGNRYVLAPMWFLLTAVVLSLGANQAFFKWIRWVALAVGLVLATVNFSLVVPRSAGPAWSTQLGAAQARCVSGRQESVLVPITPSFAPWRARIDCDRLLFSAASRNG
jgi:hypothetical protein